MGIHPKAYYLEVFFLKKLKLDVDGWWYFSWFFRQIVYGRWLPQAVEDRWWTVLVVGECKIEVVLETEAV